MLLPCSCHAPAMKYSTVQGNPTAVRLLSDLTCPSLSHMSSWKLASSAKNSLAKRSLKLGLEAGAGPAVGQAWAHVELAMLLQ